MPTDYERDDFMACVRELRCWWCQTDKNRDGKPFKSLSQHWYWAHGMDIQDVRDFLGVPKSRSFIAETLKESMRQRGVKHYDPSKLTTRGGHSPSFSQYGKSVMRKQLQAWRSDPEAVERWKEKIRAMNHARRVVHQCMVCGGDFYRGKRGGEVRKTCSRACACKLKSAQRTEWWKQRHGNARA